VADEFFRRGITKIYEVPTVTAAAPTVAQITAGTDLSDLVSDITGFSFTNSPIPTPKLSTTFTTSVPGEDTTDDSELKFYEKKTTNPQQAALAKGTSTNIVIFYKGLAGATPAIGDSCDVWPVQSTGPNREYSMGNDAAMWHCGFAPSAEPTQDVALV
jgi:hypothetical protein